MIFPHRCLFLSIALFLTSYSTVHLRIPNFAFNVLLPLGAYYPWSEVPRFLPKRDLISSASSSTAGCRTLPFLFKVFGLELLDTSFFRLSFGCRLATFLRSAHNCFAFPVYPIQNFMSPSVWVLPGHLILSLNTAFD